jgi:hypothetical protein
MCFLSLWEWCWIISTEFPEVNISKDTLRWIYKSKGIEFWTTRWRDSHLLKIKDQLIRQRKCFVESLVNFLIQKWRILFLDECVFGAHLKSSKTWAYWQDFGNILYGSRKQTKSKNVAVVGLLSPVLGLFHYQLLESSLN